MLSHIAFHRNVSHGQAGVNSDVLLRAYRDAGAAEAETFLSSGNVAFAPQDGLAEAVAERARELLRSRVRLDEPVFVRSLAYLARLVEEDPFGGRDAGGVHEQTVTFLPGSAPDLPALPVVSGRGDVTVFRATRGEAYAETRLVGGRPGTATALLERASGAAVTTRNWNTVRRLVARYLPLDRPASG